MNEYQTNLKRKMNELSHFVYRITKQFPREEVFGAVSQIRRAVLSVILNYIEGWARRRPAVKLNFFETSYGSLKETEYILQFAHDEKWINGDIYQPSAHLADEIGAMLWSEIKAIRGND